MTRLAMDVLAAGECTASCMLAMNSLIEDCTCKCRGRWHAVLIWAQADEWTGPSVLDHIA